MVGARGFEPPTSWSRTRFQSLLKRVDFCCTEVIGDESFATRLLKRIVFVLFQGAAAATISPTEKWGEPLP